MIELSVKQQEVFTYMKLKLTHYTNLGQLLMNRIE
jgi:hypothetical protein